MAERFPRSAFRYAWQRHDETKRKRKKKRDEEEKKERQRDWNVSWSCEWIYIIASATLSFSRAESPRLWRRNSSRYWIPRRNSRDIKGREGRLVKGRIAKGSLVVSVTIGFPLEQDYGAWLFELLRFISRRRLAFFATDISDRNHIYDRY